MLARHLLAENRSRSPFEVPVAPHIFFHLRLTYRVLPKAKPGDKYWQQEARVDPLNPHNLEVSHGKEAMTAESSIAATSDDFGTCDGFALFLWYLFLTAALSFKRDSQPELHPSSRESCCFLFSSFN
jgi:hypothetical protein